jgi:hypothetical protein
LKVKVIQVIYCL